MSAAPHPTSGKIRVWSAAAVLGLLLGTGSCGDGNQPIQRLAERLDEARISSLAKSAPEDPMFGALMRYDEASVGATWIAAMVANQAPDFSAPPEGAASEPAGLRLGPGKGLWIGLVRVPGNTALVLEADVAGSGLGVQGNSARLGAVEYDARPGAAQLADLQAAMLGGHFGEPIERDASRGASLWFRTKAETTWVAILCILANESGAADVRATFDAPSLRRARAGDRLRNLLDLEPGAKLHAPSVRTRRQSVALTERLATLLEAEESLTIPIDLLRGATIEVALGLVPSARDPRRPAPGASLEITCRLTDSSMGSDSSFVPHHLGTWVLTSVEAEQERWLELELELPERYATGPAKLTFEVTSDAHQDEAPLALIAAPRQVPSSPVRPGPNVIVVSIDTLRADRMALYGHDRPTTPNLDAFAENALVFDAAWANGAYTLPSHMSLFTGQTPSMHQVQDASVRRDPGRSPLLAEVLAARGWTTAAFTGGGFVSPEFGFGDGFERYGALDPMVNTESALFAEQVVDVPGITKELLEDSDMGLVEGWIEQHADESFFLFLHTYAAHQFDPPARHLETLGVGSGLHGDTRSQELLFNMGAGGQPDDFQRLLDLYDATVLQADEGFGRLIECLERLDLLEDCLIIVTSDHGKELGEHGAVGHGHALYEEMVSVPLILRLPGRADCERGDWQPGRSATPVSLIDVLPTVLEALDLPVWTGLQGQSLLHEPSERFVLTEVDNLAVKFALREGQRKTIWSPLDRDPLLPNLVEQETFDLAADPDERAPLAPDAERLAELREVYAAIEAFSASLGPTRSGALDDEALRARLEALGYLDDMQRVQAD